MCNNFHFLVVIQLVLLVSGQKVNIQSISKAQSEFGLSFMATLCEDQNCVFSPYSIYNILGMLLMASGGDSQKQLMDAMKIQGIANDEELHQMIGNVKEQLLSANLGDEVVISLADNIYTSQILQVANSYTRDLKTYYSVDGPQSVNFGDSSEAANTINKFVSDVTKGEIAQLFSGGSFNSLTLAVLVNAIYLKADWLTPFKSSDTKNDYFFVDKDKTVQVMMMELEHEFRYSIEKDMDVIEMPYKNTDLCMYIVVPKVKFLDVRDKIENVFDVIGTVGASEIREAMIYLPKFNFRDRTDLKEILLKMGVTDVFSQVSADLSKMVPAGQANTFISEAIHEAKIQVDELGTVAAAATGASAQTESMPQLPPIIKVDRPFVYMLVYKPTNTLLFMGQVIDPTIEE